MPSHLLLLSADDVIGDDVTLALNDAVIGISDVPFNCNKHLINCVDSRWCRNA